MGKPRNYPTNIGIVPVGVNRIGMIEPTEKDIGRVVLYQGIRADDKDRGVITSFNRNFVFVRYGSKTHSEATNPRDLSWEHPT